MFHEVTKCFKLIKLFLFNMHTSSGSARARLHYTRSPSSTLTQSWRPCTSWIERTHTHSLRAMAFAAKVCVAWSNSVYKQNIAAGECVGNCYNVNSINCKNPKKIFIRLQWLWIPVWNFLAEQHSTNKNISERSREKKRKWQLETGERRKSFERLVKWILIELLVAVCLPFSVFLFHLILFYFTFYGWNGENLPSNRVWFAALN